MATRSKLKKNIFVTGSAGLVGSRFVEVYKNKFTLLTPEIDELDLTDKKAVKEFIDKQKPDAIVHFAAFTDVSAAEQQRGNKSGLCWKVNVEATRNVVEAVDPKKTHFIHISTDMVFSGSTDDKGSYAENHKTEDDSNKVTWYGYTKKVAEDVVHNMLGKRATVLRLIYPVRAGYDKKLDPQVGIRLKLFDEDKLYPLFTDQFISIAFVDEICLAVDKIIYGRKYGVYHASSSDTTTPYELTTYLIKKARGKTGVTKKSSFDEYVKNSGSAIRWPKFGGLKTGKTEKELGIKYSTWKQIIDKLVKQGI